MKPQDAIFLIAFISLIFRKDSKLPAVLGLMSLLISIPLFATWTFFTAERLTWYAAAFFLLSVLLALFRNRKLK